MSRVVLTGTGVPVPDPARAGAGTFVDLDGYRIDGPSGSVVVSGDTIVCAEVEALAAGADLLVHEVRLRSFAEAVIGTHYEAIAAYHADAVDLGAAAERTGVARLALTHFIPPPVDGFEPFIAEVRQGGYTGELIAGDDLTTITC